nr:uncharacterized protein LOC123289459 [Equus asinus]
METPILDLKSIVATWLSSSSASWVIGTILRILYGLGLFLLFFPCPKRNLPSQLTYKRGNVRKRQVEPRGRSSRSRKKRGALKGKLLQFSPVPQSWPPSPVPERPAPWARGCQGQSLSLRKQSPQGGSWEGDENLSTCQILCWELRPRPAGAWNRVLPSRGTWVVVEVEALGQ